MQLATLFDRDFEGVVKRAGKKICERRQICVTTQSPYAISTEFSDSPQACEVQLNWADLDKGCLGAHCSCPRSRRGGLCEHLYATLASVNTRYLPPGSYRIATLSSGTNLHELQPGWSQKSVPEDWKRQLAPVGEMPGQRASRPTTQAPAGPPIWFVLDVTDCLNRQALVVSFYEEIRATPHRPARFKRL